MYYSTIGVLAILILYLENYDIILKRNRNTSENYVRSYRFFLISISVYYITDVLWGLFEYYKLSELLFFDTSVYFLSMSFGVLWWTRFVVDYLKEEKFGKFLKNAGNIFLISMFCVVLLNIFVPVMFSVDNESNYQPLAVRYVCLITQILILFVSSIYIIVTITGRFVANARRYRTIAGFGLTMALFMILQIWYPMLPLYTVAYLIGTCLFHTFVVNDEREEYKEELKASYERETAQLAEIREARRLAYKDSLTGVKSKLAYVEYEDSLNKEIMNYSSEPFAVAVFDINGLKHINDTFGHEKGDEFIVEGCRYICKVLKHSPVFRIGGDEFVSFLRGEDYDNRRDIQAEFEESMIKRKKNNDIVIAIGISDYDKDKDVSVNDVFARADMAMYKDKDKLKKL